MSAEIKLPRLLAAAKEFNVGQDTLVDFLGGKGFNRDDLKPTAKLSIEMYEALQKEFQGDKVAKAKSDLIDLPKGSSGEARKRREEEEIHFRKEEKKHDHDKDKEIIGQIQETSPLVEQEKVQITEPVEITEVVEVPEEPRILDLPKEPEVVIEPVAVENVVEEVKPPAEVVSEPVSIIEEPEIAVQYAPEPTPEPEIKLEKTPEIIRIEAPELEAPKILDKIDLSTIDSSTRPKKGAGKHIKPEQKPKPSHQQVAKPRQEHKPPPVIISAPQPTVAEGQEPPVITNITADRLTGPKVIGKIELPVDNDTRPKGPSEREKRKRARIPVARKEGQGGGQHHQRHGGGGQGGQQGGGRPPGQQGGQGQPNPNTPRALHPQGQGGHRPTQGSGNRGDNRPPFRREDKVIDEKEIQRKLQETQARLSGGGRQGKGNKARMRRDKRREAAEATQEGEVSNLIEVTEFISVSELASLMDVNFAEVIGKCMGLGIMVSINQRLDAEVIELVAGEFGFDVKFVGLEDQDIEDDDSETEDLEDIVPRSPIVTIMGHVDHGKTSLLDFVRKANVVSGEAGGITQHIGAYEVTAPSGKKITFLDTPGHEAFTAMRARGAKVTDIAVIVIAADDAVMPQTKEAISHAQAAGVPMIFAINKIDKEGANSPRIYEQLAGMNILVEEWGGKFQSQEISAKQGLNIDLLLEKILLEAELLELKANPEKFGTGTVIEATLDKGRGYVTTVLVLNGSLEIGDVVVSGPYFGKVKAMFNERNETVKIAGPSAPALILGLNGAPQAGEKFKVFDDESEARQAAYKRGQILREQGMRTRKHITLDEIGRRLALGNFKELNVIIKGDVDGSVEALSDSLQKLSTEEIVVNVILKGVGAISENDVTLASASDAIIMGFNVRPNLQASRLAEQEGIQIKQYSIIYNAIADIKSAMEGLLEPKIEEKEVATVEVREVYKFDKATVAGCYVQEGRLKRDAKIRLFRDGVLIYPRTEGAFAELGSLKRFKDDVKEVVNNYECGLTLKNFADLQVGDTIVAIEEEEVKRTL
jgi:translation initiation factor IF-2